MKEFLFRGKRQDGVWFEGSLLQYKVEKPSRTEKHYKIQEFNYGYSDDELINQEYMSGFDEEVIPETVGQYTGLTDKKGKKIFEGDILAETWWGKLYAKNPILCKFHNGSFCFTQYYIWDTANNCKRSWVWKKRFLKKELKYCEVIGNIYDNPELLVGE